MRQGRRGGTGARDFPSALTVASLLLTWADTGALVGQASTTVIPDRTACPSCTIEFVESARIDGDRDTFGVVARDALRTAFFSSGRFVVASAQNDGTLLWYGADGTLEKVDEREGQGPGEFQGISHIAVVDDTLTVLSAGRLTRLTAEGEVVETHRVDVGAQRAVIGRDAILMNAFDGASGGYTILELDRQGRVTRRFPAVTEGLETLAAFRVRVTPHAGGGFWTAHMNRYRIDRWSPDGELTQTLRRSALWFEDWRLEDWSRPRPDPVPPQVASIYEDPSGRIWVVTFVTDEDFTPDLDQDRDHVRPSDHPQLDAVVEVIDPVAGTVIARQRWPGMVSGFLESGHVAMYEATRVGAQTIRYGKLEVRGTAPTPGGPHRPEHRGGAVPPA